MKLPNTNVPNQGVMAAFKRETQTLDEKVEPGPFQRALASGRLPRPSYLE